MALMDKLLGELIDIVEWIDDSQHTLVWRFPRYHNQIKHGAALIVRPGQQAIFVHEGRVADVFGPGKYRLETKNLPILSTLAGLKHGFDSSIKSEVYFVSTRQLTDLKWGTPNPVILRDPDFGPMRVRAFGTYTLRAADPKTLLQELVGTDGEYEADSISELLRSIINMTFADLVASSGMSVVDLATRYTELSDQLCAAVREQIDDEYGLEIPNLYIVNVSVPAEVEQALDARSSMAVVGNLANYQAYQVGQSMPIAAQNPAGGIAGAGLGVGMGMAMLNGVQGMPGAPAAPPPLPAAPTWHVAQNGQSTGPFTQEQIAQAIAQGQIARDTLVWTTGMGAWSAAGQVDALAGLFGATPPPLP